LSDIITAYLTLMGFSRRTTGELVVCLVDKRRSGHKSFSECDEDRKEQWHH